MRKEKRKIVSGHIGPQGFDVLPVSGGGIVIVAAIRDLLRQGAGIVVLRQYCNGSGQISVPIAPAEMPVGSAVYKVQVSNITMKG